MVGVPRKKYSWLLSLFGILTFITLSCSQAPSMVNSLDKLVVLLNGSYTGLPTVYQNEKISAAADENTSLPTRLEKTSFTCSENSEACRSADVQAGEEWREARSREEKEVSPLNPYSQYIPNLDYSLSSSSVTNHRNFSDNEYNEYLPVQYERGPVQEGRSFTTGILFLIFSIIQFKIVFGAMILFLAVSPLILFIMFGPMILFLVFGPMLLMMMF